MRRRLDQLIVDKELVRSRARARELIRAGCVSVDGAPVYKPGTQVSTGAHVTVSEVDTDYVSRAGRKLQSANRQLGVDFRGKTVLDVGSSTGGFSDYVLRSGAKRVVAVDVGSRQLHGRLRGDPRLELHEQTDIRTFEPGGVVDIALVDVSFISLRLVLTKVAQCVKPEGVILTLCKPQFEAGADAKHKGVIKNDRMRRRIFRDFETWAQSHELFIVDKADSEVSGGKGNTERFYLIGKSNR